MVLNAIERRYPVLIMDPPGARPYHGLGGAGVGFGGNMFLQERAAPSAPPAMLTAQQATAKPLNWRSTGSSGEKLDGREPQRQQEKAKAQKIERDNSPGMSL